MTTTTPPPTESQVRRRLQTLRTSGCPTCLCRPSVMQIARQTGVDFSALYKFLRNDHKHLSQENCTKLQQWLERFDRQQRQQQKTQKAKLPAA